MSFYKVLHILVKEKYEAEDLLRKIAEGADFATLAVKFSTCSSAANGGQLGPIKQGRADLDFEEASLKLTPNSISKTPVRTKFGYHIIKRLD